MKAAASRKVLQHIPIYLSICLSVYSFNNFLGKYCNNGCLLGPMTVYIVNCNHTNVIFV